MKRFWWIFFLLIALAGVGLWRWLLFDLPDVANLEQNINLPSVRITDREGRILYEMLPDGGGRNTVVPLAKIPLALQQATIATEDANFYQNPGVDLGGIVRALWINLRGGETVAGGSTITQQVARNLLMSTEERSQRTLRRKLRETILAWEISRSYPKEEILDLYLNQMYYGSMTYGVEAAAQTYFGKPVSDLDLAECALLAGLTQSPAFYDPFTQMEAARERQAVVLGLMEKQTYISAEQREMAVDEPLILASAPYPLEAPHFVMMVRAQIDEQFAPEEIRASGGLIVRTALNLDWQHEAERAIQQQIERLRKQGEGPGGHNLNNAALVALDPQSGQILAMVGSPDYFDKEHAGAINMALSPRQPGSALKPLIYAAAFDPAQPRPMTPASMILDVHTNFPTHEGRTYLPENYDGLEHGPVLVREALASSLNIPAVATLQRIGMQRLFSFASQLGITTLGDPNAADLSIALGGGEVRLLDLSAAYGSFATGGYKVQPLAILDIRTMDGRALYTAPKPVQQRVMDGRVAWLISDILSDDSARLLGFGANSVLRLDRPAAVKTGTTTNFHDNWTIGYTPDLVVGVWAGNTSHAGMHNVTGLTGAAPIWHQFTRAVLTGQPEQPFIRPAGLARVEVCSLSGLLPSPACPYKRQEWFIEGTQPVEQDRFYRFAEIDSATGRLADNNTPPERTNRAVVLFLPPEAQGWAHNQGLPLGIGLQPPEPEMKKPDEPALRILYPTQGTVYQIAWNVPLETQVIRLQAAVEDGLRSVTLWVDGVQVSAPGGSPFDGWWQLQPGEHQAWAEASKATGEKVTSERVNFSVLSQPQEGGSPQ